LAAQHKLRFPVLSERGNHVARRFGLVCRVPEYQQEVIAARSSICRLPMEIKAGKLPIPATFVVDRDKTILYAAADPITLRAPSQRKFWNDLPAN